MGMVSVHRLFFTSMEDKVFWCNKFGQSADRALAKWCERLVIFTPDLLRKSTPEGLVDNIIDKYK